MKFKALGVAILVTLAWHGPALAQGSIEERLAKMEQRIRYLEERVTAQDRVIIEKDREIAALSGQEDAWFNGLEIGGVIELEAVYESPYDEDNTTDAAVATVELGIAAEIHDWVGGEIVLLHEEDEDPDVAVDAATLTIGPLEGPWSFTGGKQYLPFGVFESTLISDPLTLEIGETSETALRFDLSSDRFHGSVFAFNGDSDPGGDDRIESHGAAVGYAMEGGGYELGLDVAYINDIGDSDGLHDAIADNIDGDDKSHADHVPGWTGSARLRYGDIAVMGEYLAALDNFQTGELAFDGRGAEPSAWMLEAAYDFSLAGRDATAALGYQGTAEALALELPEKRLLAGLSIGLVDQVGLGVEWAHDEDYGTAEGGTGKSADTATVQLSAEF